MGVVTRGRLVGEPGALEAQFYRVRSLRRDGHVLRVEHLRTGHGKDLNLFDEYC